MSQPTVSITNRDTGEVWDGAITEFSPGGRPVKARFSTPWMAVFFDGIDALVGADLTRTELRVFLAVASQSPDTGAAWEWRPAQTAARLGIDERRCYAAIKVLADRGLLLRPRKGWVAFPPQLFWRGTSAARATALREIEAQQQAELDAQIAAARA